VLVKNELSAVALLLGQRSTSKPSSGALRSNWRPNQQIAISTGVEDSGTLPTDGSDDDRYLPFEGTGVVSRWRLSLPKSSNAFAYSSIADVILKVRYSARDGGERFRDGVLTLLAQINWRVQRALNAAVEFPQQWHAFMTPPSDASEQRLTFTFPRGSIAYDTATARLISLHALLTLGEDRKVDAVMPVSVEIGETVPTEVALSFERVPHAAKSGLSITGFLDTQWSVVIRKADVPLGLKDPETGFLDPKRLLNVSLVATYTAKRELA
jgi:hypothetical protein